MTLSVATRRIPVLTLALTLAAAGIAFAGAPARAGDANSPLFMLNQITSQVVGQAAVQPLQNQNMGGAAANIAQAQAATAEAQAIANMTPQQRAQYLTNKHANPNVANALGIANALTSGQAAPGGAAVAGQPPQNGLSQILGAVAGQALQNQNLNSATGNVTQAQQIAAEAQAVAAMTPQQRTEYLARKHGGQGAGDAAALTNMLIGQNAAAVPAPAAQQQVNSAPAMLLNGLLGVATGTTTTTTQNR